MKRSIYGTAVVTLSEAVEQLMIMQSNDRQSHYMSYLMHGKWAWKKLLWGTIWAIRQRVVCVDETTPTLTIPGDVERLISLSVVDVCGNLQPIGYNPAINTLSMSGSSTCSCKKCSGTNTLCEILDNIQIRTETITINGQGYQKRTWNRMDPGGDFVEVEEIPAYDTSEDVVSVVTRVRTICKLQVDERGCIAPTEDNRGRLSECCGCYLIACHQLLFHKPTVDVTPYRNSFGHWKWEANSGDVIHLNHVKAKKIIISYQSSGETDEGEYIIPEYALEALWRCIIYRMTSYNPSSTNNDKEFTFRDSEREATRLLKYMYPINMSNFMRLQGTVPLW